MNNKIVKNKDRLFYAIKSKIFLKKWAVTVNMN